MEACVGCAVSWEAWHDCVGGRAAEGKRQGCHSGVNPSSDCLLHEEAEEMGHINLGMSPLWTSCRAFSRLSFDLRFEFGFRAECFNACLLDSVSAPQRLDSLMGTLDIA